MDVKISFDWYLIFLLLGICQAIFLGILILIRSRKSGSRFVFLSLFIFSLALILIEVFLDYSGYILNLIQVDKFSHPVQFLIAPSLFLFIRNSLYPNRDDKTWIHFLPFFAILLYFSIYYFQDSAFKYDIHVDEYNLDLNKLPTETNFSYDPFYIHRFFHFIVFAHLFTYVFFIWHAIMRKYKEYNLRFFNAERSFINHYRNLFFYYLTALAILVFLLLKYFWLGDFLFSLYLTCIIYIITINITYRSLNNYLHNKGSVKYASSSLEKEDKEAILAKIRTVVEDEEFCCQSNASLDAVANRTKVSKHSISQVINEMLGKTFFEYLAEQRIGKSKSLLSDPKYHNLTIDEISFMVGYNSRSAFNRVFRSIVGTTPAAYRKSKN